MRFSAGVALVLFASWLLPAQSSAKRPGAQAKNTDPDPQPEALSLRPPVADKLTYDVEWRLIHAGTVVVEAERTHADLHLDSGGIVSNLFKVHDVYSVDYDEPYCASDATMDSQEGKRHHHTSITYDRAGLTASYLERDLIKNIVLHSDTVRIPNCTHEVLGALLKLRGMNVAPGQSVQIPMSDGRRAALVKIEAQEREQVTTPAGSFKAIRYEANMMNGVIYTRKGRAFLWLTDDERHLPVQIRLRMNFPVGTVTLQLTKEEVQ